MNVGSLKRLVIRNTAVTLVAQAATVLCGLATTLVLSRHLGVERFGELNYLFAFYYFFLAATDMGTGQIVVREASQDRERAGDLIGATLLLKLSAALVAVAVAWIVISVVDFSPRLRDGLFAFALILPLTALQFPILIFQVTLRASTAAAIAITIRVAGLVLVLLVVALDGGLRSIVAAIVATEALCATLIWIVARRFVHLRVRADFALWKRVLRSSAALGASGLFVAVINRIDFVMLERMTDLRQVGIYAAAYKVTTMLESLPLIVMGSVFPLMSGYASTDPARLRRIHRQAALGLAAIGVPLGLIVTVAAPLIVRVLFGPAFAETAPTLAVLVWATVFLYVAVTGGNLLISTGRERANLWICASGAALNVALNVVLIPRFGPLGAAFATSATFLFIMVATMTAANRALGAGDRRRIAGEPAIAIDRG